MSNNRSSKYPFPKAVPGLSKVSRIKESGSEILEYIALDRNKHLSPFPDWFLAEIRDSVDSALLSRYPVQDRLHGQLCRQLELAEENLILTLSSDSAFKSVFQAYVRPGDKVAMLDLSFARLLMDLKPKQLLGYGYWGAEPESVTGVNNPICFATFVLEKSLEAGLASDDKANELSICLGLPLDWPVELSGNAQILAKDGLEKLAPSSAEAKQD